MGSLVLSRRDGEKIMIGKDIIIAVAEIQGNTVRLAIDAPREVEIHREEVFLRIQKEKSEVNGNG